MTKLLTDCYKIPGSLLDIKLDGVLNPDRGFFSFGEETTCFGRTTLSNAVRKEPLNLYDVARHCARDHGFLSLPFDVDEVINNLRLEKYINNSMTDENQGAAKKIVRSLYYMIRPLLPVHYRKYLQRIALRDWQSQKFPRWPVDYTVESILEKTLLSVLSTGEISVLPFIWFWPKGYRSCAIMTHDVETAAGRDSCNKMMDIEDQYGIKSSFEIVPEVRYEVTKSFLRDIVSRGREICIHGLNHDGHLFSSKDTFMERVGRINEYAKQFGAIGFRSPVMYRNLDWYEHFTFEYDMSVPNVGHLDPQRGGCCTVMPYFIGDIVELPLTTIQDYPLYHILQKDTTDLWKEQSSSIMQKNGLISFIIHPDYTLSNKERAIFNSLLNYLSELREMKNVWIALPRDVCHWWIRRDKMKIIERNGKWVIVGEGSEEARIAHAKQVGDRLVYEIQ